MSSIIRPDQPLFDYFFKQVNAAHRQQTVLLPKTTRLYLAELLSQHAVSAPQDDPHLTLAERHVRAVNAPLGEQVQSYRDLGDHALITVGFFEESLSRRAVGSRYYIEMGVAAYHRLHTLFNNTGAARVFHDLSEWFEPCVLLLNFIQDGDLRAQPERLRGLLERWQRTGDARSARRLQRAGLLLPAGPTRTH